MQPENYRYWFRAKKYGWGWGLPNCWQGWMVFAVWLALVITAGILLAKHLALFIACVFVLGIGLFLICLLKGEPPRWRWGKGGR
jgi:hypothetical protein